MITKKDWCLFFMSSGMFMAMVFFIAGLIITALGGGSWELMRESEKIMTAAWIDWLGLMFSIVTIVGGAIAYNVFDKEQENG